jgi:quinol monooxygenase YgiN
MSRLLGIARFRFHGGKGGGVQGPLSPVHGGRAEDDTGTLRYDVFMNDDESEALVIEEYEDSAALLEHLAHIARTCRPRSWRRPLCKVSFSAT